jgi:hypothetical protein
MLLRETVPPTASRYRRASGAGKAILDKLEPLKPPGQPSKVVARMRGTKRRR